MSQAPCSRVACAPVVDTKNVVALSRLPRRAAPAAIVSRPGLWKRLDAAARVTMVSARPGSGKTASLRSWIGATGLAERVAWVTVRSDDGDRPGLWPSVVNALRQTIPGSELVRPLMAAPDSGGWAVVERLLTDLAPLPDQLWLVIDDLHKLDSDQARRQLELLVTCAPGALRFLLATRHDMRLRLHRLRLEGKLTEIRGPDLRFTADEARELLDAAGVELPEPSLTALHERTEGHPDQDRLAAQFSGRERTVAEYPLAEVLERQPAKVRRRLLRTGVLERVNGELADLPTGDEGGERAPQELEDANPFVASVDAARSWFRYHHLFAGLLRLELRRAEPHEVAALHELAASWFEEHGYQADATRHAQAAGWRQWMVLLDRNAQERPRPPLGPLSKSEIRVLKYLAIHLSAPKIAGEPSLSTSTVKTHMRNLYRKLGAHSRAEAVQSGRVLGLLAPPARQR
jgi:LuxR family transcriptional regulator, maltose regulon positive regulatory protein